MPEEFVSPFNQKTLRRIFVDNFKVRDFALKLPPSGGLKGLSALVGEGRVDLVGRGMEPPRVREDQPMLEGMRLLQRHPLALVVKAGRVGGYLHPSCLNQPAARMWLFGLIGVIDRHFDHAIARTHPGESWREVLTPARLQGAVELQEERSRRGSHAELLHCLQLSDKIRIMASDPRLAVALGYHSRRHLREAMKAFEKLRNHLAHHQDIHPECTEAALGMAERLEDLLKATRLSHALNSLVVLPRV